MSEEAATKRGDGLGSFLGFVVFLGGIALLGLTFKIAYELFRIPAEQALNIVPKKALDINVVAPSFGWIIVRIILLIVMALVGSLIANRGIKLFTESRHHH